MNVAFPEFVVIIVRQIKDSLNRPHVGRLHFTQWNAKGERLSVHFEKIDITEIDQFFLYFENGNGIFIWIFRSRGNAEPDAGFLLLREKESLLFPGERAPSPARRFHFDKAFQQLLAQRLKPLIARHMKLADARIPEFLVHNGLAQIDI